MPKEFCEGQTLTIVKIFTELEVEDGQEYTDDESTVSTITVKNDDGDNITFAPILDHDYLSDPAACESELTMFFEKPASKLDLEGKDCYCEDCGCMRFKCGCSERLELKLVEGQVLTVVKVLKKKILVEPPLEEGGAEWLGRIGFFNEFDIPKDLFVKQEERKDRFEKRI